MIEFHDSESQGESECFFFIFLDVLYYILLHWYEKNKEAN